MRFPTLRRTHLGPKISVGRVTIGPFEEPTRILKRARATLTNLRHLSLRAHNCEHAFDERAALELCQWESLRILHIGFTMRTSDVEQAVTALQIVQQVHDVHLTIETGFNIQGLQEKLARIVKQIPRHVHYLQLDIDLQWSIDANTSPTFVPSLLKSIQAELCERFDGALHGFNSACNSDHLTFYSA